MTEAKRVKDEVRKRIWDLMVELGIATFPKPPHGRIPNFIGADLAAGKVFNIDLWRGSKVVEVSPDSPQRPVRYRALLEGKTLLMPTPKLKEGFLILNPNEIPKNALNEASTIGGAFKYGILASDIKTLSRLGKVDLIITGSVAVDIYGTRLGKGGGYSDLEYAVLKELKLVDENTPIITTVHDIQLIKDKLPREKHDVPVDLIATPTKLHKALEPTPKPKGLYKDLLNDETKNIRIIKQLTTLK